MQHFQYTVTNSKITAASAMVFMAAVRSPREYGNRTGNERRNESVQPIEKRTVMIIKNMKFCNHYQKVTYRKEISNQTRVFDSMK